MSESLKEGQGLPEDSPAPPLEGQEGSMNIGWNFLGGDAQYLWTDQHCAKWK